MRNFIRSFFTQDDESVTPIDVANAVRKSVTVTGRVQGVGFRYFVRQEARHLGITGWVMNLNDGSVTMEIQGTPEILDELIKRLKKGNGYSKVETLKSNDIEVEMGENKFGIKY